MDAGHCPAKRLWYWMPYRCDRSDCPLIKNENENFSKTPYFCRHQPAFPEKAPIVRRYFCDEEPILKFEYLAYACGPDPCFRSILSSYCRQLVSQLRYSFPTWHKAFAFNFCSLYDHIKLTIPKFSIQIAKTIRIIIPSDIEILAPIHASLENLQNGVSCHNYSNSWSSDHPSSSVCCHVAVNIKAYRTRRYPVVVDRVDSTLGVALLKQIFAACRLRLLVAGLAIFWNKNIVYTVLMLWTRHTSTYWALWSVD